MNPEASSSDSSKFVHPLQSVLDAMGHDPAMRGQRRRIQEYIEKSAAVMHTAEPDREDLKEVRAEQIRKEVRSKVEKRYLSSPLMERDQDWLQHATELLRVLTDTSGKPGKSMRDEYSHVIRALVMGAYARMAPDTLVDDLSRERLRLEEELRKNEA
ncbi:MAG: hypothetical protein JJ896_07240 [Rhodothermales bacterium]|nr:hypothetical protein [Rhodothermales bacterium]MBO6779432.1 hypothetical protein [Rhodothermales bacterium]